MRAIQITEFGGPEVLTVADLPEPTPSEGFELVKVSGAGVNYADTHQTENSYLSATELPLVPGSEVVGTLPDGRRIASLVGAGGYAEWALAPSFLSFDLPDAVSDGQALALMVQGLTAWHLLACGHRRLGMIVPQNRFLVHAVEPRLAGMRAVLEEAGMPDLQLLPIEKISLEEAHRIARQLAADPDRPTGLYGFNDEYCFHLLRAFRDQGLRVPEDIALVGADITPFCELMTPSLTSVHIDIAAIGSALINLIDHLAHAREGEIAFESIPPPQLIQRESS